MDGHLRLELAVASVKAKKLGYYKELEQRLTALNGPRTPHPAMLADRRTRVAWLMAEVGLRPFEVADLMGESDSVIDDDVAALRKVVR